MEQRFLTYFAARDWDAYAEILSDDVCMDDRRQVVNAGVRRGRDAEIASQRAVADVGVTRLHVNRYCDPWAAPRPRFYSVFDGWGRGSTVLSVSEIDAGTRSWHASRSTPRISMLPSRSSMPETSPAKRPPRSHMDGHYKGRSCVQPTRSPPNDGDCVNIDHRPGIAFAPGDVTAYIGATYDVAPDVKGPPRSCAPAGQPGVVVTEVVAGTSTRASLSNGARSRLSHLTATWSAGSNFSTRRTSTPRSRASMNSGPRRSGWRMRRAKWSNASWTYFAARDWAALAEILTDESFIDDRRPVVNAGLWDGRDAVIANLQALADAAANITSVIATRGERLALTRIRSSNRDPRQGDFGVEMLNIVEIDTDGRIVAHVEFDPNDIDAAFEELEARYLAGEAAAHAHTWSVIAETYAAINRHEFPPTTPDSENIDHRQL